MKMYEWENIPDIAEKWDCRCDKMKVAGGYIIRTIVIAGRGDGGVSVHHIFVRDKSIREASE